MEAQNARSVNIVCCRWGSSLARRVDATRRRVAPGGPHHQQRKMLTRPAFDQLPRE